MAVGKYDGAVMGGILGTIVAYPTLSTKINSFLVGVFPSTWNWFGSFTQPLLIIAVGTLIGLLVDKTK